MAGRSLSSLVFSLITELRHINCASPIKMVKPLDCCPHFILFTCSMEQSPL